MKLVLIFIWNKIITNVMTVALKIHRKT